MGLYDKTWEFIDAAKETYEYNELLEAKKDIENDQNLKEQFNNLFCKLAKIYPIQNYQNTLNKNSNDLCAEFEALQASPKISRFLKASEEFNTMISKTYNCILDELQSSLK